MTGKVKAHETSISMVEAAPAEVDAGTDKIEFGTFDETAKPHTTSMAVWDIPTPIVFNAKFKLKVGVKCSDDCKLTDKKILIYDQEGIKVATGTLGGIPWSVASTLYWAEVELNAPGAEGYYNWTAKFPNPDLELPHEEASHIFGFRTARPPEHVVTVEVIDKDTGTPIQKAHVMLHPYRGATDEHGVARMRVPKGDYKLYVSKVNKLTFQATVKVAGDITIKAELLPAPDDSNYPYV